MRKLLLLLALVIAGSAPLVAQGRTRVHASIARHITARRGMVHRAEARRDAIRRTMALHARRLAVRRRAMRRWARG